MSLIDNNTFDNATTSNSNATYVEALMLWIAAALWCVGLTGPA
ncbi:MAG: hypothetical protein AAFX99_00275 [Myxococcota bacterium]